MKENAFGGFQQSDKDKLLNKQASEQNHLAAKFNVEFYIFGGIGAIKGENQRKKISDEVRLDSYKISQIK
jgi:hypothetical protein